MTFNNLSELIARARKDNACEKGIEFALSCKSLEECIHTIPDHYRLWCLCQGYEQFIVDGSKLSGLNWRCLLIYQPQFSVHCDWSLLNGADWRYLLSSQPQFAIHCDWSKINGYDWRDLLIYQPQFSVHCDWSLLDGFDWCMLLSSQPQFALYKEESNDVQ